MMRSNLIIAGLVLLNSCKQSLPSGVIRQHKMQEVLWDVLKADALAEEIAKKDSSTSAAAESIILTKKVFLIHHISAEEFKNSYSYYAGHPDIMKAMLDSINAQQSRKAITDTPFIRKRILDTTRK